MTRSARLSVEVSSAITRALDERRIVGAVVLVAHDGETVFEQAAGLANREACTPMAVDALFRLASVTRAIVAAAAMTLVERGTLSLDSPVTQWLPEFQPTLPSGESPQITIRHLLTHTAGLDYRFQQPADGPYVRANISDGFDQPGFVDSRTHRSSSRCAARESSRCCVALLRGDGRAGRGDGARRG